MAESAEGSKNFVIVELTAEQLVSLNDRPGEGLQLVAPEGVPPAEDTSMAASARNLGRSSVCRLPNKALCELDYVSPSDSKVCFRCPCADPSGPRKAAEMLVQALNIPHVPSSSDSKPLFSRPLSQGRDAGRRA